MNKGIIFDIYHIKSPQLTPYIQYILFNYSDDPSYSNLITSFANTNICLGIVKEKELHDRHGVKSLRHKAGIHSYLSGMYLAPHKFEASGTLDEICIDFTPLGYYRFFRFPAKTYIFHEDIITEGFGQEGRNVFEAVFETADFQKRGQLIEAFLQKKILNPGTTFLEQCLHYIHRAGGEITLKELSGYVKCSEKKIVRAFLAHFDLTPKDYIRILRFRRALSNLNENRTGSLTHISYESDYFDQSHFIKDFRFFTEKTPRQLKNTIVDVKKNVIIGIE